MNAFPSLLLPLAETEKENFSITGLFVYLVVVLAILFVTMAIAKKDFSARVFKNQFAELYEQIYLFVENMCVGVIGSHGRKYIPFIMTLWMLIFVGNVVSLFAPAAPTGDLNFNLAMALLCVGYVQWEGIRQNGLLGHVSHFAGPKLGAVFLLPITFLIFIIEIVSELMKNVSLSLRLFGNIHGGHLAVESMNGLGAHWLVPIPIGAFLLPLKLLTCVVQAMVFTLLTCVYLSLVTAHHDEGHEHNHENEHALEPTTLPSTAHA